MQFKQIIAIILILVTPLAVISMGIEQTTADENAENLIAMINDGLHNMGENDKLVAIEKYVVNKSNVNYANKDFGETLLSAACENSY